MWKLLYSLLKRNRFQMISRTYKGSNTPLWCQLGASAVLGKDGFSQQDQTLTEKLIGNEIKKNNGS